MLPILTLVEQYALSAMGIAMIVLAAKLFRDGFYGPSALFMGISGVFAFFWKFILIAYGENSFSGALSEICEVAFAVFMAASIFAHISSIYSTYAVQQERLVLELQDALANVKTLSGLLPLCAWCGKARDDRGYWDELQRYIEKHSDATFTHGICPDCMKKVRNE